jgi:tripartite ATP-independent transporter DctM subunit
MTFVAGAMALMFVLLACGVWVAVSLGTAGYVGLYTVLGHDRTIILLGKILWELNTSYVVVALPLFIFSGEILAQAGIMRRIYESVGKIVSFLPGGLLQTNIVACTIFAACSGTSLAAAATIGSVGYPQIKAKNYNRPIALGSIAAGGGLGILIPPSIIFIIYGGMAEVSIGKLFLAGVFPGLILALVYSLYIGIRAWLDPRIAPQEPIGRFSEILHALASLWPVIVMVIVVLGGIYGGVASPSEVAALAAAIAILFTVLNRSFSLALIRDAGLATIKQTSMLMFILTSAKLIATILIYYQVPNVMTAWLEAIQITPMTAVILLCLIYLVLGMFFDGLSMMVITVPFVAPIMIKLGVDLIWLGVIIVMMIEIALLTPPVGLNLFVLQGATGEPIRIIIQGAAPFIALQFLVIILLFLFPQIALYLPATAL